MIDSSSIFMAGSALEPAVAAAHPNTDRNDYLGNAIERGGREPHVPATKLPGVRGAVEYLLGHYTQSLDLPELADRCGLSPKGLRGQFKRHMGITPMECLIRIRVEKAKRLLAGTNTPIKDIAVEVGFYDHSSLNRHFIRLAGMPPSIYRDQRHAEILLKFGALTEGAAARQVV